MLKVLDTYFTLEPHQLEAATRSLNAEFSDLQAPTPLDVVRFGRVLGWAMGEVHGGIREIEALTTKGEWTVEDDRYFRALAPYLHPLCYLHVVDTSRLTLHGWRLGQNQYGDHEIVFQQGSIHWEDLQPTARMSARPRASTAGPAGPAS